VAAACLAACAGIRQPEAPATAPPRAREDVVREALSAVVRIESQMADGSRGYGTGFVVDGGAGLVATNRHVILGATQITITLPDGKELQPAQIRGLSSAEDLAVLVVGRKFPHALELRTDPPPQPGEEVLALGHPLGLSNTVTEGIVSGLREVEGQRMIQTSAAISGGNSGGPLVDRDGRVLGVVTWKVSDVSVEGLGFATAASSLRSILDDASMPVGISDFYREMLNGGDDGRRWRAGHASVSASSAGFAGTWKPGRSDRLFVALAPDGPNRFLGSLVRLDGPLQVFENRIERPPAITMRRDFLLSRSGDGWTTEFGWIWDCQGSGVSRRADGTYVRDAPRTCIVPTNIDVQGVHGTYLRVTVTQPRIPSEGSEDYGIACQTCLEGFSRVKVEADFERMAGNVAW
jgi:hypothetical protein